MFANHKTKASFICLSAAAALAASLTYAAALDGDFTGVGNAFFEKISFRAGGKVRITAMGMTKVGTYEIDGKEVLITVGAETNVFTIDAKGCVVGGGFLGKYCKGGDGGGESPPAGADAGRAKGGAAPPAAGKDAASEKRAVAAASDSAALSGRYKMGDAKMSVTLDFQSADKLRITVAGKQAKKESRDAKYTVAGDRVTINVPDGSPPLVLTRKGNVLEGAPEGETMKMTFVKQ